MRRTAATGTLRGDLTVALDGLGGCLSRLRLEGRSTGVGWCSGARRGGQVAMGGPQEPSDRSGRLTADGVISDAGLAASPARTAPHTSEGGHGYVSLLGPAARRAEMHLSTPRSTRFAHSWRAKTASASPPSAATRALCVAISRRPWTATAGAFRASGWRAGRRASDGAPARVEAARSRWVGRKSRPSVRAGLLQTASAAMRASPICGKHGRATVS